MNSVLKKIGILLVFVLLTTKGVFGEDALEIIKKLDKVMYPNAKSEILLIFNKKDGKEERYKLISYSKDLNQKTIVRFAEPASMIGNDIILLEKNVWQKDSNAGRIIKIPSNLSFGGTGFSYGDVVRLNLSDNYAAEITSEDNDKWLINLTAKDRNAPYFRIELEVKKVLFVPIKSTCYGKNNKVIKYIEYSDLKSFNNVEKPTKFVVKSPLDPKETSTMIYTSEVKKDYPDRIFNKNNLDMRQEENY